ncbi:MAG: hypothetical protein H2069_05015 [Legionella sp.]|nr:hypothetical protein [Legionella sp.]
MNDDLCLQVNSPKSSAIFLAFPKTSPSLSVSDKSEEETNALEIISKKMKGNNLKSPLITQNQKKESDDQLKKTSGNKSKKLTLKDRVKAVSRQLNAVIDDWKDDVDRERALEKIRQDLENSREKQNIGDAVLSQAFLEIGPKRMSKLVKLHANQPNGIDEITIPVEKGFPKAIENFITVLGFDTGPRRTALRQVLDKSERLFHSFSPILGLKKKEKNGKSKSRTDLSGKLFEILEGKKTAPEKLEGVRDFVELYKHRQFESLLGCFLKLPFETQKDIFTHYQSKKLCSESKCLQFRQILGGIIKPDLTDSEKVAWVSKAKSNNQVAYDLLKKHVFEKPQDQPTSKQARMLIHATFLVKLDPPEPSNLDPLNPLASFYRAYNQLVLSYNNSGLSNNSLFRGSAQKGKNLCPKSSSKGFANYNAHTIFQPVNSLTEAMTSENKNTEQSTVSAITGL